MLLSLLFLAAAASVFVGSMHLGIGDVATILSGRGDGRFDHILWNIRLPRSIAAVVAGAGLGVSGAVMQNILKNHLASPFTVGVSQGAAFGAAFAIIALHAGQAHSAGNEAVTVAAPHIVVFCAFCGSLLAVLVILALSMLRGITAETIILAGVAISAFFGAGTMLLQYFASDVQTAATVFWTFGDLGKAGWRENAAMLPAFLISFACFVYSRWSYNALQWGDDTAASLGVRVRRERILGLVLCSLTVAVATAFLGIIGFIGLIAPHGARYLTGSDYRFLIPYSAAAGALLLLVCDMIARLVMPPVILPVGIVTSFAGAPLFLYLLVRKRRA
jgi:iron complex transport system permease protein